MPVMFFYLVVDSTKCVTLNILRSTGRPQITVWGNSVSCLAVMLPMGWVLSMDMHYGKRIDRSLWSTGPAIPCIVTITVLTLGVRVLCGVSVSPV